MSETLTVPTAFNDISELAEGLADRVDEERLMLYGPNAVGDNEWIRFAVLLLDQSPALEGMGRAVASIDGGEERPESARYDIVLDSLQFDGRSEAVYERIQVARASVNGPSTGEVSIDQLDVIEQDADDDVGEAPTMVGDAAAFSQQQGGYGGDPYSSGASTAVDAEGGYADAEMVGDDGAVFSVPPSVAPPEPPLAPTNGGILVRPSLGAQWLPRPVPRAEPRPSSGMFMYGGGLPIPAVPPRPDLDPSYRVTRAPQPSPGDAAAARAGGSSGTRSADAAGAAAAMPYEDDGPPTDEAMEVMPEDADIATVEAHLSELEELGDSTAEIDLPDESGLD